MADITTLLQTRPVLVEGAMGTLLMHADLPAGQLGETVTLQRPAVLANIHARYVTAGARVLVTNTFNANRFRLAHAGMEDSLAECNRLAVQIARDQGGAACAVAGSLGPTGRMLAPYGPLARADAVEAFAEQARHLADAGVDLLMIETMFDLQEALAAVEGCRQACDLPISAALTFNDTPKGFMTAMGNPATDALNQLVAAGATIAASNCQLGSVDMVRLATEAIHHVDAPLMIKPNAGQPEARPGAAVYPETPDQYARCAVQLADLGVALIGGCCGTTPEHIAAARDALAQHPSPKNA